MSENTDDIIKRLKLTMAADSYPVLEDIKYFGQYNNHIEESFGESISSIGSIPKNKDGSRTELDMDKVRQLSERKKHSAFRNIMRASLLTALCAFIENVIKTPCLTDGRKSRYKSHCKKIKNSDSSDKSTIGIAKSFLIKEGFNDIDNLTGWDYIKNMMQIRNRFVHNGGQVTSHIQANSGSYDLVIKNNEIILGNTFIEDYITFVESFSIKFAKIVYVDESK